MGQRQTALPWLLTAALVIAVTVLARSDSGRAAADMNTGSASKLQVPRFVSLKSDHVNVRAGPTKDQAVNWVFMRAGLPVEITAEFETWRRIRDWEGAEGWVYHSLLSGRRTGMVTAKSKDDLVPLYGRADKKSAVTAMLQAGVLGSVTRCKDGWCELRGEGFDGWIEQDRLWGVYPNEVYPDEKSE
jgi:SH3-like domain-containing protein